MSPYFGFISGLLALLASSRSVADDAPEWIWSQANRTAGKQVCLSTQFEVKNTPRRATLRGLADYTHAVFEVNGTTVADREPYGQLVDVDVSRHVKTGKNKVSVCCRSVDGPSALFVQLEIELTNGKKQTVKTGSDWRATVIDKRRAGGSPGSSESTAVTAFGRVARYPWGETSDTVTVRPLDDYTQWKQAQGTKAGTDPATFQLLPGFEIELLRSAQEGEGSWVAMTFDPQGRLVVAKEKQGMLRFTLPSNSGGEMKVESINDTLHECRGLLFAHGSLYAMANNDKSLFRLQDTNRDDRFDKVEKLKSYDGTVGHGRNQITLGPDGMIYGIFGDAVFEPEGAKAFPSTLSQPTAAEETRSGYLARSSDGKEWEVLVRGLRNPFGIAFNRDGEAFTYDADAEYDMGAPWYRPTRVNHLISGGDFGWRRVTKQWPPYVPDRPDMPQPTLTIGKGSPTAVVFGSAGNFPAPYRDALFILDWAYGRILAVHLDPRGSSYAAKAESFVRGRPANVTDVEFGPDGAMYFVTGGRGTQSALYRVKYRGPQTGLVELTAQQRARRKHANASRQLRRHLEALHGKRDTVALAKAWPQLKSDDPWIRHASRVAVEWLPEEAWQRKAINAEDNATALQALLALIRVGPGDAHSAIVDRLARMSFDDLTEQQKLTALFLYDRCLGSDGASSKYRNTIVENLDRHYPDGSPRVNRQLSLLLEQLNPPLFVERTMAVLDRADVQKERMHYLFVLRDVKTGWTAETRKSYFDHLRRSNEFVGGDGMPTFLRLIKTAALDSVPEKEREQYEKLLSATVSPWLAEIPQQPRPFVRKWTISDLTNSLDKVTSGRNFENGKRMFAAAKCIACHRVGNRGGAIGPDLSAVSSRFRPADVLVSIIDPSRVVSAKYRNDIFVLNDGRTVTGRVVPGGDFRSPSLRVAADPLKSEEFVEFSKSAVDLHKQSLVSPMPKDLLNHLTEEEILDLLAYVNAAGRAEGGSFRENTSNR